MTKSQREKIEAAANIHTDEYNDTIVSSDWLQEFFIAGAEFALKMVEDAHEIDSDRSLAWSRESDGSGV